MDAKHFVVVVGAINVEPPEGAAPVHDFRIVPAFNVNELIELIKGSKVPENVVETVPFMTFEFHMTLGVGVPGVVATVT